jgi:hypothetical protein
VTSTICTICQRVEATGGLVCRACLLDLHRSLSELATLAKLLPAAAEPGRSASQRVAGSRETPTGTRLVALDLSAPLRSAQRRDDAVHDTLIPAYTLRAETYSVEIEIPGAAGEVGTVEWVMGWHREPVMWAPDPDHPDHLEPWMVGAGDQTGPVPIAAWLDQVARAWATQAELPRPAGGNGTPTTVELTSWIYSRLNWACQHRDDLADFAAELREYVRTCRQILNVETHPVHLGGRYCPRCTTPNLWQDLPDLDGVAANHPVYCRNQDCGARWTWDEYHHAQRARAALFRGRDSA